MAGRASTRSRWGRHGATNVAGGGDAERGATVAAVGEKRRVGAHQTRVVLKLRKMEAAPDIPWLTELVCMFFNAQGDVLRIHRANLPTNSNVPLSTSAVSTTSNEGPVEFDGDVDPITLRRFESPDAIEKERLSVSLACVHPFVEVVGFLVSYSTNEIARRPQLNAFQVTCDASLDTSDDEDDLLRGSLGGGGAPTRLHSYTHEPSGGGGLPFSNYVVLSKFFRDPDCRSEWICHSIGASGVVRSSVNAALAQAMQVFLLDIIPEIEIAHRNALNTVASICAALSRDEVLGIEEYFHEDGVSREEFAKLLLLALLDSRPEMRRLSRATALVALLYEMFDQIDINGDGAVDWEEFTSFCVSLGLIATKEQKLGSSTVSGCVYHQQLVGPATRTFPYQIRRIRSFPSLRLIAVIQNKCSNILMYDPEMKFLHEFNHVTRLAQESSNASLAILDVEHVTTRNWLVVSSNDHVLTFWSVVNATTGAYVFAFKIGSRCPIPQLQWCGIALNRLVTISSEGVQLWDLEAKRVQTRLTHHRDRITACLEVQSDTPLLATCSFDNTIAFLHVPSLAPAFELRGHVQGIQHMDYRAHGALLLSSGFEHQAYCWSITTQSLLTTLGGHQASLIGARFVSAQSKASTVVVVTGDERGHFRLWDISRCLHGHTIDAATALQSFDVVTPNLCNFHTFALGMNSHVKKSDESQELVDIVTGAFRLFRFHAVTHLDELAPPRHVAFNSISNNFVGSVDGVITVWSANSGAKVEEPITIRVVEVCAIAFDMPRQRKLFVATSDGAIRLYNPITATLLTKTVVHDGTISSLSYCPRSSCLISTGHDRRLAVSFSSAGKTEIDILRTVENAHDSCITCAAYSQDLELVATGDDAGNLHIYDFQRLYLVLRCEGHTDDIRALHFHFSAALLFSADASGLVFIWNVSMSDSSRYQTRPIMQLVLTSNTVFFMTEPRPGSVGGNHHRTSSRPSTAVTPASIKPSPVTSILSTPETKHGSAFLYVGTVNGAIWGWDFRVLTNHARKTGVGSCFEYRFIQDRYSDENTAKYNAMLRVNHKTSVLKLHADDANAPNTAVFGRARNRKELGQLGILPSCEASCAWQAHTASVNQLRVLPLPGQLFSVSFDGSVKVWDPFHACLGTISTLTKGDLANKAPSNPPTTSTGTTASSSWKFAHHHHMAHEAREQHIRIAREMLRRVKRKPKRSPRTTGNSRPLTVSERSVDDEGEASDSELARVDATEAPVLPASLAAAEKLLANYIPFSKESVRAGAQTGLFGVEEAKVLRELARGPHNPSAYQNKPLLAPLVDGSPQRQDRKAQKMASYPQGNEHELPVMRTMRNFPIEVERRRAAERRQGASLGAAPDVTLSPFLQEKLATPSPTMLKMKQHGVTKVTGAKSTPKRKPTASPALSMTMEASVVVMDQPVSLPLLHQPQLHDTTQSAPHHDDASQLSEAPSRSRLASVASSPCLPTFNPSERGARKLAHSVSQLVVSVEEEPSREGPTGSPLRSNIERKMRLYEGAGISNASTSAQDPDTSGFRGASRALRSPFETKRQMSQPDMTKRPGTREGSASVLSNKRGSHGALSPNSPTRATETSSSPSNGNPFGPHYTTKQVIDFAGVIARYDADCSGDIDKSEWVQMLQSCRPLFGSADLEAAERLFHSIDRDDSGKISLQEILPMMFSKATPEQLQKMLQNIQTRIDAAAAAMAAARSSVGTSKLLGR